MSALPAAGRLIGFALVVMAAAIAGVLASTGAPTADVTFDQDLANYPAEKPQFRHLPDGGRIAIGSRTGHDLTVQWQDPATRTWTAPRIVQNQRRFWTHDITVRRLGPTVAIAPDFWRQKVLDDDYAPSFTGFAVCRDYRCDRPHVSENLSGPVPAEGGDLVAFGLDNKRVLLWEHGKGYRRARITGIPRDPGAYRVRVLADGTFVGVAGRWDGEQCHYDLYLGGHRSPNLRKVLESPGFFDLKPCYLASVDTKSDNRVDVWVESLSDEITFLKRNGRWTLQARGLTRMQIKDTRGKSTLAPMPASVRNKQALFGSPDLRRILYQHRPDQDEPWSKPRVIARAPAGTLCRQATLGETGGLDDDRGRIAVAVLIHCYAADRKLSREDEPSDVGLVLASDDGEQWHQATVNKPRWEPFFSRTRIVVAGTPRSLSYQPGRDSLDVLQLPMDSAWDGIGLSLDGTHALRITGNPDPNAQCTASWSYAAITDSAWPKPTPFTVEGLPRRGTCTGSANADAPGSFMVGLYQMDWSWEGGIQIKSGTPELAPPLE